MHSLLSALKNSTGKKSKSARKIRDQDENGAPALFPRRLLSETPTRKAVNKHSRIPFNGGNNTPKTFAVERLNSKAQSTQASSHVRHFRGTVEKELQEETPGLRANERNQEKNEVFKCEPVIQAASATGSSGHLQSGEDNIKVIVRVRPSSEREHGVGASNCVQPISSTALKVASNPEPHVFSFDYVAQQTDSQESIFRAAGRHIVENCLNGFNGCIFAYGQTGSGKTFTMLGSGSDEHQVAEEQRGLIQRMFEHLYMRIRERQEEAKEDETCKYMLRCSFLEIYNESITDLLRPGATCLAIREDIRKGVYVEGLLEEECSSEEDVIQLLRHGITNRRVGETNMNDKSSRSHCVFTATVESKTQDAMGKTNILFSRLHLVDLAGSERQKSSGAQGDRLREASSINKSLSTLGHVISSLVDLQSGRARHIPYRDSRLTFLLQDSLGGNAKACLIATVSPATLNMAETLSTLRFADQAKKIKNKAVVNEDITGEANALRKEIIRLREELSRTKRGADNDIHRVERPWAEGFLSPGGLQSNYNGSPVLRTPTISSQQDTRRALVAALRREEAGRKELLRRESELLKLTELLKVKDADLQRQHMIGKLKEARLTRMQKGADTTDAQILELQQEVQVLKSRIEAHPEVKRFATENLQLSMEVERLRELVDQHELRALQQDVGGLRSELLAMADSLEQAKEEAVVQQALAESLKIESDLAVDHIRSQASVDKEQEVLRLTGELSVEHHQLQAAMNSKLALQEEVATLQRTVNSLQSAADNLQSELSPMQRKASEYALELDAVKKENCAAMHQASSELVRRSQAELELQQVQSEVEELHRDCARLRQENMDYVQDKERNRQEVERFNSQCKGLKEELQLERSAAASKHAEYQDALQQLDIMRHQLGQLQTRCEGLQRELMDSQELLACQKDEHDAAQSELAERLAVALQEAQELQCVMNSNEAAMQSTQQSLDAAEQEVTHLARQMKHVEMQLKQRDNELKDLNNAMEDKVQIINKQQKDLEEATAFKTENAHLQASSAEHEQAAASLATQVATLTVQLQESLRAQDEVIRLSSQLETERETAHSAAAMIDSLSSQLEAAERASADSIQVLGSQLGALQNELLEKESRILLVQAEVGELKSLLHLKEEAMGGIQKELTGKEEKISVLRQELASEVAAAAQQVQSLLAAQQEAESLRCTLVALEQRKQENCNDMGHFQQQLDVLREQIEAKEAVLAEVEREKQELYTQLEASRELAASAALAKQEDEAKLQQQLAVQESELKQLHAELGAKSIAPAANAASGDSIAAHLEELVAEREQWIEEMQEQRRTVRAASDVATALETKLAQVSAERRQLAEELSSCKERESKLDQEVTALTGQHNIQQRIQYHKKVKEENNTLREELSKLRIELNIINVRYERAKTDLARFRSAAGQEPLPNWDEEEKLRQSLALVQAEKIKVQREYEEMASFIIQLSMDPSGCVPPSPCGSTGDIVLEFEEDMAHGGDVSQLGTVARKALEDIRIRQQAAYRTLEDQEHQIRLMKESSKLQRIRRSSGCASGASTAGK